MLKHLAFLFCTLLLVVDANSQTRRRVNNTGVSSPFTNLQTAINASLDGDIIIVEHSDISYGNVILNRNITIYGPGYYLQENWATDSTQWDFRPATVGSITVLNNASGATIQGVTIGSLVVEQCDSLEISRNKITGSVRLGTIGIAKNVLLTQNFIEGSSPILVEIINATSYMISNNYIKNTNNSATNSILVTAGNGLVLNNLFLGSPDNVFKNSTVQNNYFEDSEIDVANSSNLTVTHNIGRSNFLSTSYGGILNNNISSVEPDSLYCFDMSTSPDVVYSWYNPNPLNPILIPGADGKTRVMFGGALPYVPSGMPPIPSIWLVSGSSTGTTTGGASVEIKTKSRK
jgi:hypothetical protein